MTPLGAVVDERRITVGPRDLWCVLYRDLADLTLAVYVDRDGAWSDRWVALLRVDGAQITERELGRVTSWARGMR